MIQYRFCCHEWRWCGKDCDLCTLVSEKQKQEQKEQLDKERKLYRTQAVMNGKITEGE